MPILTRNGVSSRARSAGGHGLQMLAVDPQELFFIEDAGGGGGVLQGEVADQFFPGEDLLVPVGPAQPGQVVAQRLGQEAFLPVFQDRFGPRRLESLPRSGASIRGMCANRANRPPMPGR